MIPYVLWGVALWGGATLFFRVAGHLLLSPERAALTFGTFLLAIPVIAAVTLPFYRIRKAAGTNNAFACGAAIALPGMLLDTAGLLFYRTLFPNLPSDPTLFAAWLLWAYSLILLSGFAYDRMFSSRQRRNIQ